MLQMSAAVEWWGERERVCNQMTKKHHQAATWAQGDGRDRQTVHCCSCNEMVMS